MRSFQLIILSIALGTTLPRSRAADGADEAADLYFRSYLLNREAAAQEAAGELPAAQLKLKQASDILDTLARQSPEWQPKVRAYRQRKIAEALARIEQQMKR